VLVTEFKKRDREIADLRARLDKLETERVERGTLRVVG
jgi:hypothetical protein